jgi:hypothetical protein
VSLNSAFVILGELSGLGELSRKTERGRLR